jgi:hypothetical protein
MHRPLALNAFELRIDTAARQQFEMRPTSTMRPSSSTMIRSECRAVDTRCEINSVVCPRRRRQLRQDVLFRFGIDARETVVEYRHRCLTNQSARSVARCSPAGQRDAAFADDRIELLRETLDHFLEVGRRRCFPDQISAHGIVVCRVVAQRVAEQKWVLRHHRDLRAQLCERIIADVLAVDEHGPRRRIGKRTSSFSSVVLPADTAHDRDRFAFTNRQRNVVQRRVARRVVGQPSVGIRSPRISSAFCRSEHR